MSLSKLDKEIIIRPDYSKCGLLTNVSLRTGGYLSVAEIENHLETSIAIWQSGFMSTEANNLKTGFIFFVFLNSVFL